MEPAEARALLAGARVARLATAGTDGRPHLVPVCFALDGNRIVTAIDHKPKRGGRLRRLANIEANPNVAVLADHYEDADWSRLWWVRADGVASVRESDLEAVAALQSRYRQYRDDPPAGPVIVVTVERWSGWRGGSA
jgi:PPOX class probable F420-dependent enzyme